MVRLPSSVLDEPDEVQRVQCAHEPRLHVHLPLFIVRRLTVGLAPVTGQVTPLALDDLRERLV